MVHLDKLKTHNLGHTVRSNEDAGWLQICFVAFAVKTAIQVRRYLGSREKGKGGNNKAAIEQVVHPESLVKQCHGQDHAHAGPTIPRWTITGRVPGLCSADDPNVAIAASYAVTAASCSPKSPAVMLVAKCRTWSISNRKPLLCGAACRCGMAACTSWPVIALETVSMPVPNGEPAPPVTCPPPCSCG
jgi:hypothetical protein